MKNMSDTELKVMDKIWENPEGVDSEFIYAHFQEHSGYAVGTISTLLHRITKKGFLKSVRKGKHKIFIPLIMREDYFIKVKEVELGRAVEKIEDVISSYYGKAQLSNEQGEMFRNLLKELRDE